MTQTHNLGFGNRTQSSRPATVIHMLLHMHVCNSRLLIGSCSVGLEFLHKVHLRPVGVYSFFMFVSSAAAPEWCEDKEVPHWEAVRVGTVSPVPAAVAPFYISLRQLCAKWVVIKWILLHRFLQNVVYKIYVVFSILMQRYHFASS